MKSTFSHLKIETEQPFSSQGRLFVVACYFQSCFILFSCAKFTFLIHQCNALSSSVLLLLNSNAIKKVRNTSGFWVCSAAPSFAMQHQSVPDQEM